MSLVRAIAGLEAADSPSYMSVRERIDFLIITLIFGVLFGVYVLSVSVSSPSSAKS